MRGINKSIILGTVGTAVTGKNLENTVFCSFKVVTNRVHYQQPSQQKVEESEWHRIIVYGNRAEFCLKYIHIGQSVYLEGYSKTRKWTDEQGFEREVTEIVCEKIELIQDAAQQEDDTPADPYNNEAYNVSRSPFPQAAHQQRNYQQGRNQNNQRNNQWNNQQGRNQNNQRNNQWNNQQGRNQNNQWNNQQGRNQNNQQHHTNGWDDPNRQYSGQPYANREQYQPEDQHQPNPRYPQKKYGGSGR